MARRVAWAAWSGGNAAWLTRWRRTIRRQPVRVKALVAGGLMHQLADGVVDQQVRPDLLLHHGRGLAAQHGPGTALVGLELIQDALDLPALVVQHGQLAGGDRLGSRIEVTSR